MWYIFVILYVSYLILGPHWESKLLERKPLLIVFLLVFYQLTRNVLYLPA